MDRKKIEKLAEDPGAEFNDRDLAGCDLSRLTIDQKGFKKANLAGASLRKAELTQCDFKKADLGGADLTGATFTQCEFKGTRFAGTRIHGATFEQCVFREVDLAAADVRDSEFSQCEGDLGLDPAVRYAAFDDIDEEADRWALAVERLTGASAVVPGTVKKRKDDDEVHLTGEWRGRAFRLAVDVTWGTPVLALRAANRLGGLTLHRTASPDERPDEPDGFDPANQVQRHWLSARTYLEAWGAEIETMKAALARLPPDLVAALVGAMEAQELASVTAEGEAVTARWARDLLRVDLPRALPGLLDALDQLAAACEALEGPEYARQQAMLAGAAAAAPRRCGYCQSLAPADALRCPSCGASF